MELTDNPNLAKRNNQKGGPRFLSDPRRARDGEVIGAGFFVFRRGGGTGRVRAPEYPFEHPTIDAALAERDSLAAKYSGETFEVLARHD